jgi:hypothetical protein
MSAQTVSTCVVCGAQTDAFLCGDARRETGCLGLLLQRLGDCAWLAEQLSTTLSRQDKVTAGSAGFVTGTAEKPIPLNLGASDAAMNLRDKLFSWIRCLWEDNTPAVLHCGACGEEQAGHAEGPLQFERTWYVAHRRLDMDLDITSASRWLMRHPSWIALNPAADELHGELSEAIYRARRSVDIPKDVRVFLGKCGFEIEGVKCKEELHSWPGDDEVTCAVCGTWWIVEERQSWLLATADDEVASAPVLSALLTSLGVPVGEADIRKMAKRGEICAVSTDAHRKRSYRVGDVLSAFLGNETPLSA